MFERKFSDLFITVHGPEITKWKLNDDTVSRLYYGACRADDCDHDPKSWMSGFFIAAGVFEDKRITEKFFKRKDTKNDKEDLETKTYETFPFGVTPVKTIEIDGEFWFNSNDALTAFMKEASRLHSVGIKEGKRLAQQEEE